MPRISRTRQAVGRIRDRPYEPRSSARRLGRPPRTPPIQSARFDFPSLPAESDDTTDISDAGSDDDDEMLASGPSGRPVSENDETDAEDGTGSGDDDDATDASGDDETEETEEDLSFIVRDSQEVIVTDQETDENGPTPSPPLPVEPEVIHISGPPDPPRTDDNDVYDGEMSPVEIIEPEVAPEKPPAEACRPPEVNLNETVSDDRSTCVICCENLMSDGRHEVSVLTGCGHIFGKSCILEWIKKGKKECPNCKKRTKNSEVRKIYPPSMPLVTVDNSEVESLRKKVDEMKTVNEDVTRKLAISESQLKQCQSDLRVKDDEIRHLKINRNINHSNSQSQKESQIDIKFKFLKEEIINPLTSSDISRVMAVDQANQTRSMCVAAATNQSYSSLSPLSHGVYNIDLQNLKKGKFLPLHKDEIKDLEYGSGFLLTGSLDKTLKTVDIDSNKIQAVFVAPQPVWSVTWNRGKQLVYGGLRTGQIVEFDTRTKSKDPMRTFKSSDPMPIHSLYFKNNGLLYGQFKQITWVGLENDNTKNVVYQFDHKTRRCMSLHIQDNHILTTFREKPPKTEFLSLSFTHTANPRMRVANTAVVNQFVVGQQHDKITKDRLFSICGETVAACSNQQTGNISLYNPSTAELIQTFPRTKNAILDSATFQIQDTVYLAELDGRSIRFHQCIS